MPKTDLTPVSLRLRLIGQMTATDGVGAVALPRVRKTRAVLAILALAGPVPVLRDHITGLLWSRRAREQARASLRQSVHELQEMLGEQATGMLVAERTHLRLDAGRIWVDVQELARANTSRPEALALLDAKLLEDLAGLDPAFDAWIASESERMRAGALALAEALLAAEHAPAAKLAAAARVLAIAPAHEGALRATMEAHAERGERSAALAAFERGAASLAQAGHLAPSAATLASLARIRGSGDQPPPIARSRPRGRGVWLGVVPFRSFESAAGRSLSLGLAEEITTALSRFRWINLIAPGSIAALVDEPHGASGRWQELGLDFLLDGSVQRGAGERIRITVRLLDMHAGAQVVWSSRFDRQADDLLSLQDEIAAATVAQLDPELMLRESRRATARPVADATAYELMLQAIPALYRLEEAEFRAAGSLLEQAAIRAPEHAAIHAWWAYWHAFLVGQGWADDPAGAMRRAGQLAERAVMLDPSDARALAIAGHVRSFLHHQSIDEIIGLHERALALNPNLPLAWVLSGLAYSYAGQHQTAIIRIHRARQLSPFDPHSFFFDNALMMPELMLGAFETVVSLGQHSLALNPSMSSTYKGMLSALGHLGRDAEAAGIRTRLLQTEPGFTLAAAAARSPLRRPEDRELYVEGLYRAGLR